MSAEKAGAVVLAAVVAIVVSALLTGWLLMLAVPLVGELFGADNPPHPSFWLSTGAALLLRLLLGGLFTRKS